MSFWDRAWNWFKDLFKNSFEKQVAYILPLVEATAMRLLNDPSLLTDPVKRDAFAKELLEQLISLEKEVGEDVLKETIKRVLDLLTPAQPT